MLVFTLNIKIDHIFFSKRLVNRRKRKYLRHDFLALFPPRNSVTIQFQCFPLKLIAFKIHVNKSDTNYIMYFIISKWMSFRLPSKSYLDPKTISQIPFSENSRKHTILMTWHNDSKLRIRNGNKRFDFISIHTKLTKPSKFNYIPQWLSLSVEILSSSIK